MTSNLARQRHGTAAGAAVPGKSGGTGPMQAALEHVCRGDEHLQVGAATTMHATRAETPTARQLAGLSWLDRQNEQIASELCIAERTVKLYLSALFDARRARNRTRLLVRTPGFRALARNSTKGQSSPLEPAA